MPAPRHLYCRFSGVFGPLATPYEIWSFGFALDPGTGGGSQPGGIDKTSMVTLANALSAHWTSIAPGMSNQVRLTEVKASVVGAEGFVEKDANGTYVQGEKAMDATGSGTLSVPPQIALVHSLLTLADGAVGRGRFYLPSPAVGALEANGQITTTSRDAFVTRCKTFLDAVNTSSSNAGFGRVVVASGGSVTKGIPAALRPVTTVAVGRVLDTQRRRRNAINEAPAGVALA